LGCGSIEWADAFDHATGLLEDEADAEVREHLVECDACRADGGELKVLADRLMALGEATFVRGREAFADRARGDVRSTMGSARVHRQTSSWRVVHSGESQRMRRATVRRRRSFMRGVKIVLSGVVLAVAATALACYTLGEYVVDRFGGSAEGVLGINFAELGLRPAHENVAGRAEKATSEEDLRALSGPLERLLRWEFSSSECRAGALVYLELALRASREGSPREAGFVASAVLAAGGTGEGEDAPAREQVVLARKARRVWRSGDPSRAQEILLLSTLAKSPLALYYSGAIAAGGDGKDLDDAVARLAEAAEKVPAVWADIAWRRMRAGETERARRALDRAPGGPVKDALRELVAHAR
jgi:hypothetical protein